MHPTLSDKILQIFKNSNRLLAITTTKITKHSAQYKFVDVNTIPSTTTKHVTAQ